MSLDPRLRSRCSVRLRARDYSLPGHYYLTICTQDRRPLFGSVIDGVMKLNDLGHVADKFWNEIPRHFPHAELDEYVIMPNHVHGVIRIVDHVMPNVLPMVIAVGLPNVSGLVVPGDDNTHGPLRPCVWDVGANNYSPLRNQNRVVRYPQKTRWNPCGTSRTIGSMVRGFKIGVTRHARLQGYTGDIWQRNYHDHVIRNERSLERIRAYIRANPANWNRDKNNSECHPAP